MSEAVRVIRTLVGKTQAVRLAFKLDQNDFQERRKEKRVNSDGQFYVHGQLDRV